MGATSAKLTAPHPKGTQNERQIIGREIPVNEISRRQPRILADLHAT
jgi:hypothetical protein